ncbi:hypothetical protein [Sphingobacterium cellulitidis]
MYSKDLEQGVLQWKHSEWDTIKGIGGNGGYGRVRGKWLSKVDNLWSP